MPKKEIPISDVQAYLDEIVNRTGSQRKAALRLGIGKTQLRIWLKCQPRMKMGKTYTHAQYVTRDSAALILRTLRQLRRDGIFYDHTRQPGPKPLWVRTDDAEAERSRRRRAHAAA